VDARPAYAGGSPAERLARAFAARTIRRDLAGSLRRVVWVGSGPPADPAPGRPLVLYANHHVFHDSYLLWHLLTQTLRRPFVVWMEAWDRAPLFSPLGALPFPADDAAARVRTLRETARRMAADPRTALLLYPEGGMRPPEAGIGPFRADLPRLARLLPVDAAWCPAGVRMTWWGESRPTALLHLGAAHGAPDGAEPGRLAAALARLDGARPEDLAAGRAALLLDGAVGAEERWDLSALAPFFRRWTAR
jgi:1-acyl-sn-glycerol-3-phosphate acyltransferase